MRIIPTSLASRLIWGGALLASLAGSAPAMAFDCDGLWRLRNTIYKRAGYCFKTARGVQTFGNAGCLYDDVEDVPLSARERANIAEVLREERRMGCPR